MPPYLFRFHKWAAFLALALILSHPLLLAAGSQWSLLWNFADSWHLNLGRAALLALLTHIVLAAFRRALRMEYQAWRAIHNALALSILPLAFVHSWTAGGDLALVALRVLWVWLLLFAAIAYFWHRVVQPRWVGGRRFRVTEVVRETADVWTIQLAPPPGTRVPDYLPGQFHFLTFQRDGLPAEEHHWTISSSPTQEGFVASTIKESGDFTATIGRTKPGDTALVEGPFGRFSYTLFPGERDLVFIAGGIGITPLMSMLRHLRDTKSERGVRLIYANRTPEDIVFREELAEMEKGGAPRLEVVHVITHAPDGWEGEKGLLDEQRLPGLCGGDLQRKAFYLCAPGPLMEMARRCLRRHGVPARAIHFERFRL